jgi:hypothetical protein
VAHKGKSPDGYVRVPTAELSSVRLSHLLSEKDPTIGVLSHAGTITITGFTEWVGSWQGHTVTVGWDWGALMGALVVLNASEIRTNILLIARDGQPEPPPLAKIHLLEWVDSHPWSETVVDDVLAKEVEKD